MERRDFLTHSGLVELGAAFSSKFGSAQSIHPQPPVGSARTIILYVYDGSAGRPRGRPPFVHPSQGRVLALERLLTLEGQDRCLPTALRVSSPILLLLQPHLEPDEGQAMATLAFSRTDRS